MACTPNSRVSAAEEDKGGEKSGAQGWNEETDASNPETQARTQQMMLALKADNVDGVKRLLETGLTPKEFLTRERLLHLYDKANDQAPLKDIGVQLKSLMGRYYESHHLKDDFQLVSDPTQELFLWCVLTNHYSLADFFWQKIDEPMAAALVATRLLEALGARTKSKQDKKKMANKAKVFRARADNLLDRCYQKDPDMAKKLLTRKLSTWGNSSCCLIALRSFNKNYISEPACQDLLHDVWMGQIEDNTSYWKIFPCIFLFPLICCCIRFEEGGSVSCCQKLYNFYHAPVVIFFVNAMAYLTFLGAYSYLLVVQLSPGLYWMEPLVFGWAAVIYVGNYRHFVAKGVYFRHSVWMIFLDTSAIVLLVIGVVLRSVVTQDPDSYQWGRVMLAVALLVSFLRVLNLFYIQPQLGPKVVMIGEMVENLIQFMLILLVVAAAYAIASEAILYPNMALSWKLLYYLPRKAHWHVYGELFLEEMEGDDPVDPCTDDPNLYGDYSQPRCPSSVGRWLVPPMTGIYMMVTNVLLLNLLIAMFSSTYQAVEKDARKLGHFLMFELTYDYSVLPALPPPFIVISWINRFWCYGYKHTDFLKEYKAEEVKGMVELEREQIKHVITHQDDPENKKRQMKVVLQRLEKTESALQEIKSTLQELCNRLSNGGESTA